MLCLFLHLSLLALPLAKAGSVYECGNGREVLRDVFSPYGPVCDHQRDCSDGSDEQFCDYNAQNRRFKGRKSLKISRLT